MITVGKILSNTKGFCNSPKVNRRFDGSFKLQLYFSIVNKTQYQGLKFLKKITSNLIQIKFKKVI